MADEKKHGSILRALVSPQLALALIGMVAFGATIRPPEEAGLSDGPLSEKQLLLATPDVLKKAAELEPAKLLAAGKPSEAMKKAYSMAEEKRYDVVAIICAGNTLVDCGDEEEGLKLLKRAVSLAPNSRYVRINYAEKLAQEKKTKDAMAQYQQIVKENPRWTKPRLALATMDFDQGKYKEAANELKYVIEADPNNYEAMKMRGLALARSGKARSGLEEYVRGIDTERQIVGLPDDMQRTVKAWGSLERTIFEIRKTLNMNPKDHQAKIQLARILIYTGQAGEAKTLLLQARKKAATNWQLRRTLAIAFKKEGEDNLALSEFMQSVNLERREEKRKELD